MRAPICGLAAQINVSALLDLVEAVKAMRGD
jgi:hypothetical protein